MNRECVCVLEKGEAQDGVNVGNSQVKFAVPLCGVNTEAVHDTVTFPETHR